MPVSAILERIALAGEAYKKDEQGSREVLIELSRDLVASLEIPSEFLQRSFWAEPALSANCKIAVDVKLFRHLQDAGNGGLSPEELAEMTGVDVNLLQRVMRHLNAMRLTSFTDGKFRGTPLSDGLAAENYQQSIDFCYNVARPSFNGFPEFFKQTEYKMPTSLTKGPFQVAHNTDLPFFGWLDATPPHLADFNAFMSAYRAGKASWRHALGGCRRRRGHDLLQFFMQHTTHPGRMILQDRPQVIESIQNKDTLPFEVEPTDFFTPQLVKGARAYYLHSILHDWDDEDGIRILENLKSALKPGYSRVLLNEIVLSEEKPTLAATSMDMMMLAHLAVRERTEAQWRNIVENAGLKVIGIYN